MNSHGRGIEDDVSYTLNTFDIGDKRATELVAEPVAFKFHQGAEARTLGDDVGVSPTITTDWHQPAVTVHQNQAGDISETEEMTGTITSQSSVSRQQLLIEPICMAPSFSKRPGQQIATTERGASYALTTGEPPRVLI